MCVIENLDLKIKISKIVVMATTVTKNKDFEAEILSLLLVTPLRTQSYWIKTLGSQNVHEAYWLKKLLSLSQWRFLQVVVMMVESMSETDNKCDNIKLIFNSQLFF